MKDGYSFDDEASARHAYQKMFVAYLRSFRRMGLKALPMATDTGPIGGDLVASSSFWRKPGVGSVLPCRYSRLAGAGCRL